MNRILTRISIAVLFLLSLPCASQAQLLFSEDFEVDPTADWTFNPGPVAADPSDHAADFFFDYSTVGIPSAPNSTGGSTRGMNLQANRDGLDIGVGVFSGMSVSPIGEDFSAAGDYKVTFDLWGNFPGPFPAGSSGTTQLSTFGIGTSGTFANWPSQADGLFFAATLDGGSGADYRAYSQERPVSYQFPHNEEVLDGQGNPIDSHAIYHAGSRNNTAALYSDNFGNESAPQAQIDLFEQQTGSTNPGVLGMTWREVEISVVGELVEWKVDGVLLISVDMTDFVTPLAGGNIMFGHSDINGSASSDPNRFDLLFTLIDNIEVAEIVDPGNTADFNGNGIVDAADYTVWRDNLGLMGSATQMTGDANGDTNVDETDYDLWKSTFGTMPGASSGSVAGAAVPEPSASCLMVLGWFICSVGRRVRN